MHVLRHRYIPSMVGFISIASPFCKASQKRQAVHSQDVWHKMTKIFGRQKVVLRLHACYRKDTYRAGRGKFIGKGEAH